MPLQPEIDSTSVSIIELLLCSQLAGVERLADILEDVLDFAVDVF